MSARVTMPRRTTLSLQLDAASDTQALASSEAHINAAIAEADALAGEMLAADAQAGRRRTEPVAAMRAPRHTGTRRHVDAERQSFFEREVAPPLDLLGEKVTHVAQRLGCEAALVERAAEQLQAMGLPVHIISLTARAVRVGLVNVVAQRLDVEPALVERAAAQLELEQQPCDEYNLTNRARQVRYEESVQACNAHRRELAADCGEYGLESIAAPSAADRTPQAAHARLRRDSERYGWILRPAR